MAVRSVFAIDVDDSKFVEFQKLFAQYQEAVVGMPGAWNQIANSTDEAAASLDSLTKKSGGLNAAANARAMAQGRAADMQKRADTEALSRSGKLGKASDNLSASASQTAMAWRSIAGDAKRVYGSVDSATKSLAKWSLMKGVLGGLLGVGGGLAGLDRLASSAAYGRRQSMSSGVPFGDRNAFKTDYGRFVDPDGMIANVATAKTDATSDQYRGLLGSGLSPGQIQNQNAADLSVSLLHELPKLFPKGADDPLLGTTAEARGLTSVISPDEIKAYLRASPKERADQDQAYAADKRGMAVDGGTLKAWTDLNTQLTRAGSEIEKAFVVGLAPLAPEFGDLSKSAVALVGDFLKSKEIKEDLDGLATGLGNLDKALHDPSSWWNRAGGALNTLAKKEQDAGAATHSWLMNNAPWLNPANFDTYAGGSIGTHHAAKRGRWLADVPEAEHERAAGKLKAMGGHPANKIEAIARGHVGSNETGTTPDTMPPSAPQSGDENAKQSEVKAYIRAQAAARGIDPDTAVRVALSEGLRGWDTGRDGPSHAGDYKTSFGAYQLHYGGSGISGMNAMGLGDDFTKQTGMDARDPKTWRAQVDFALNRAAKAGWTDWHGAANTGISKWEGIGTYRGSVPATASPATPAERGIVGSSPFGTIGDRAAFDAEQRRTAGQAKAGDEALLAAYKRQQASPPTASLSHPQSHAWAKLSEGRTKDDRIELGDATMSAAHTYGHPAFDARARGAVQARNHAMSDRVFSDDDLAAVKAARGARPASDDRGSSLDKAKGKSSGLNLDQYHRKQGHDISIMNASGADVSSSAGQASYG